MTEDGILPIDALADTNTSLRDALSMMLTATGSHLVVVDADGRYVGLTSADLISQELAGAKAGAGRVPA